VARQSSHTVQYSPSSFCHVLSHMHFLALVFTPARILLRVIASFAFEKKIEYQYFDYHLPEKVHA